MIILKFRTKGQHLYRIDTKSVVAKSRNELYAEFTFDEIWKDKEPITAQFIGCNTVIDVFVEDDKCLIPWEVLQDRGILKVCLIGGDLLTTNTVDISVLGTGVIGGLVPTTASPSVYNWIVETVNHIKDSVDRFLKGDFSDVDLTTENLKVSKKANISEIVSDFVTSKYTSVKNKLKFGSNGFDLSVESTDTKDNVYKHQIKTSNSKMQVNGADLEFNSEKNERHNVSGKYQVYAEDEVEIARGISKDKTKVFRATNNQTGMYSSDGDSETNYVEVDRYNTRIGAENDVAVDSNNFRVNADGTAEIINTNDRGSGGIIRLIQKNTDEEKTTKCYLGTDNAVIGVDGESADSKGGDITAGFKIGSKSIDCVGDFKIDGIDIKDFIIEKAIEIVGGQILNIINFGDEHCGVGADFIPDNVRLIITTKGSYLVGSGNTTYGDWDGDYSDVGGCPAWEGFFDELNPIGKLFINGNISLGECAFNECDTLTELEINSKIDIPAFCFSDCRNLRKIILNGVTDLGLCAFDSCESLESIIIRSNEVGIGIDFRNCKNLKKIVLKEIPSLLEKAFSSLEHLESVTIESKEIKIYNYIFERCTNLTKVELSGINCIGMGMFFECSSLTSITIPDSVTSISSYAFGGCTGLTNIEIPNSVTYINASVFSNCNNLTTITINKPADSISGAPWGAANATVIWKGDE